MTKIKATTKKARKLPKNVKFTEEDPHWQAMAEDLVCYTLLHEAHKMAMADRIELIPIPHRIAARTYLDILVKRNPQYFLKAMDNPPGPITDFEAELFKPYIKEAKRLLGLA